MTVRRNEVSDPGLAAAGQARIEWADGQMPVLRSIRDRFARERPLEGVRVAACLHVTAETANLIRALIAGGASAALCASNPLSTQDDVAAALVTGYRAEVHAVRGEDADAFARHVLTLLAGRPQVTLDDGADLLTALHLGVGGADADGLEAMIGGTEETTTGLLRLRALDDEGRLACPVIAVNEARTERLFNDHYGTGQSALDGILRATNLLLAGRTFVVVGYGWTGKGIALRARGAGAQVIVCEIDPMRALEARMEGFQVMPATAAAEQGDVFVTVTGSRDVLTTAHFERMKDGAVLANAGHFDIEIDLAALRAVAVAPPREVLPLVESYDLGGRRLNLLASGRVVNLAAGQGHPAAVMDMSFANQALAVEHLVRRAGELPAGVHPVPDSVDREVARLKLESLGVLIDSPTEHQQLYGQGWGRGH
ncbi:MAG: adenosylhomocysteinase [Solirubrobacterales bacterium]|nr:adenosylhomocysteinase [Solirubrobacterales bacterium]